MINFSLVNSGTELHAQEVALFEMSQSLSKTSNVGLAIDDVDGNIFASEEFISSFLFIEGIVHESSPNASSFAVNFTEKGRDVFVGSHVTFISGVLRGETRKVSAYDGVSKRISVSPSFRTIPAFGDRFVLVGQEVLLSYPTISSAGTPAQLSSERKARIQAELNRLTIDLDTVSAAVFVESLTSQQISVFEQSLLQISGAIEPLFREVQIFNIHTITRKELLLDRTTGLRDEIELRRKVLDIRAALMGVDSLLKTSVRIPIVESYMTADVTKKIHFVMFNPLSTEQTIGIQSYLPKEISVENVHALDGFDVFFDRNIGQYFVADQVHVGPGEIVIRTVDMENVWEYSVSDLELLKSRARALEDNLKGFSFESQAVIYRGEVELDVDLIIAQQNQVFSSPFEEISQHRQNQILLENAEFTLNKLNEFVFATADSRIKERATLILELTLILAITFAVSLGLLSLLFIHVRRRGGGVLKVAKIKKENRVVAKTIVRARTIPRKKVLSTRPMRRIAISTANVELTLFLSSRLGRATVILVAILVAVAGISGLTNVRRSVDDEKNSIEKLIEIQQEILDQKSDQEEIIQNQRTVDAVFGGEEFVTPEAVFEPVFEDILIDEVLDRSTESSPLDTPADRSLLQILNTPTGTLNVRSDSDLNSLKITSVLPGEEYEYLNTQNGWHQIILGNGNMGWVFSEYIAIVDNNPGTQ